MKQLYSITPIIKPENEDIIKAYLDIAVYFLNKRCCEGDIRHIGVIKELLAAGFTIDHINAIAPLWFNPSEIKTALEELEEEK